ncbi:hypothetical protein EVAR_21344_1 [Eumeta japonica]|uniref:Uncharacterized protein n=1 Tax=Eumeta variegata TaxID=151549 RepID=A0A4C1YBM9_EUMVA|nr:hypothetical protein EVAR_21344_1 [Eumeta japonica]
MSRLASWARGDGSSGRQYLQGGPGVTENVDQPVFYSSPSVSPFAARPSPPERPCRRDRVVASSTTSPYRPATPSGPPDFAFDAATVGKMRGPRRRDDPPSGVEVLDALVPDLRHREQPREDERGMQGHCAVSPACLQSDAALDSVEHRTPSFLVAGAQAHEAYRTIGSITVMYMVLSRSPDSRPRRGCSG